MSVKLAEFERYVLPWVAAAPIPAVHAAIRDAAIEFCERTRFTTQFVDGIAVSASDPEICITVPNCDYEVYEVIDVWTSQGRITPKTKDELSVRFPMGWTEERRDSMALIPYYICTKHDVLRLVPAPSISLQNEIRVYAAMRPTRTAKTLCSSLLNHCSRAIGDGALALLHSHTSMSYAQPKEQLRFRGMFERAMTELGDNYAHGFNKPQLRTGQDEFT